MLYTRQITTPANTSKSNPVKTTINAWRGVLTRAEIRFPPGPEFLLHVVLKRGSNQIMPVDPSYDVVGDDETVRGDLYVKLTAGWNKIDILTWNDDTAYSHDCVVRITVLPEYIASPYNALKSIAMSLKWILRRVGLPVG